MRFLDGFRPMSHEIRLRKLRGLRSACGLRVKMPIQLRCLRFCRGGSKELSRDCRCSSGTGTVRCRMSAASRCRTPRYSKTGSK